MNSIIQTKKQENKDSESIQAWLLSLFRIPHHKFRIQWFFEQSIREGFLPNDIANTLENEWLKHKVEIPKICATCQNWNIWNSPNPTNTQFVFCSKTTSLTYINETCEEHIIRTEKGKYLDSINICIFCGIPITDLNDEFHNNKSCRKEEK